jgi:putative endonuclease
MNDSWFVYMVRCNDHTLYTGITTNLEKRVKAHNSENGGARYTKSRRPVTLVYSRRTESRSAASKLEYQIKKMSRKSKLLLIGGKK